MVCIRRRIRRLLAWFCLLLVINLAFFRWQWSSGDDESTERIPSGLTDSVNWKSSSISKADAASDVAAQTDREVPRRVERSAVLKYHSRESRHRRIPSVEAANSLSEQTETKKRAPSKFHRATIQKPLLNARVTSFIELSPEVALVSNTTKFASTTKSTPASASHPKYKRKPEPTTSNPSALLVDWLRPQLHNVSMKNLAQTAVQLVKSYPLPLKYTQFQHRPVMMYYGMGGFSELQGHRCPPFTPLVVVVFSGTDHFMQRQTIRETWGAQILHQKFTMNFLVGVTRSKLVQRHLMEENAKYGHIIQGNFVDSYRNLTLKTTSMLEWLGIFCPGAAKVFKIDDDIFLQVPHMLKFLYQVKNEKRTLYGKVLTGTEPMRDGTSKYFITKDEYPGGKFPDYLAGFSYLFSNDLVEDMYRHILLTDFIFLEDLVLTGYVAKEIQARLTDVSAFYNGIPWRSSCVGKDFMTVYSLTPINIRRLNALVRAHALKVCG